MLIGFTGVPGSGKSFSADIMLNEWIRLGASYNEVYKCGFGHKIKELTLSLFPEWNHRHINGDLKEIVDDDFGISPRRVQQIIGKSLLEIDSNLWSNFLFRDLNRKGIDYNDSYKLITIDDIRFPQDFEAIKSRGGIMIGLRPGNGYKALNNETINFETEKYSNELVGRCDHIYTNNFDESHSKLIRELIRDLKGD